MDEPVLRSTPAQLYLVDDDPLLLDYLELLLRPLGASVLRESSPLHVLAQLPRMVQRPTVVVSDLVMPELDGIELAQRLRGGGFGDPIILISAQVDVPRAVQAMREGFFLVLEKPIDDAILLREVASDLSESRRRHAERQTDAALQAQVAQLTAREREVLMTLASGCLNKTAADRLGLSPRTVETHRQHIMEKLGLRNSAELIRFGVEWQQRLGPSASD